MAPSDLPAGAPTIPLSEPAMLAAAAEVGLVVPPDLREGVLANLSLLARHAAILRGGAA